MTKKERGADTVRLLVVLLAAGAAFLLAGGPALAVELPGKAGGAVTYVPDTLIVKFKDQARAADKAGALSGLPVQEAADLKHVGLTVVKVPAGGLEGCLAALADDPSVAFVNKVPIYRYMLTPPDPDFAEQWPLDNNGQTGGVLDADIDAVEAWDTEDGSSNTIVVAVIDSGVDFTHPDLAPNIWTNPGEDAWSDPMDPSTGDGIDNDGNGLKDDWKGYDYVGANVLLPLGDNDPRDAFGHGTHVAGIVAAASNALGGAGVNFNARIIPIKIGDDGEGLNTQKAIQAINDLIELKTRPVNGEPNLRVINASWGGAVGLPAMETAIEAAGAAGILFVAAAGNGGLDGIGDDIDHPGLLEGNWPAAFPADSIVAVAALDDDDFIAEFSNFGAVSVDLGAPGMRYYSTMPTYECGLTRDYGYSMNYDHLSGTSMASPCVAGAASLLWAADPALTVCEVKSLLMEYADANGDLAGITVTGGRLNVNNGLLGAPVDSDGDGDPDVCDSDDDDDGCADDLDPARVVASADADADGYGSDCDCDDGLPAVNPGEAENCGNGIDDDCDGKADAADPGCGGGYAAVANSQAAVFGPGSLAGSGALNGLGLLLLPAAAILLVRRLRRR